MMIEKNNDYISFVLSLNETINEEYHISESVKAESMRLCCRIKEELNKHGSSRMLSGVAKKHVYFSETLFKENVSIDCICYIFSNSTAFDEWITKLPQINGVDTEQKLFKFTVLVIDRQIISKTLYDTVQHECEHFFQELKIKKSFNITGSLYNFAVGNLGSPNEQLFVLSNIIYLSRKFEQEGFANGLYGYLYHNLSKDSNADIGSLLYTSDYRNMMERLKECQEYIVEHSNDGMLLMYIDRYFKKYGLNYNRFVKLSTEAFKKIKRKMVETLIKVKKDLNIKDNKIVKWKNNGDIEYAAPNTIQL